MDLFEGLYVTRSLNAAHVHFWTNWLCSDSPLHKIANKKKGAKRAAEHTCINKLTQICGWLLPILIPPLFKHEPAAVLRDGAANGALLGEQTNREE